MWQLFFITQSDLNDLRQKFDLTKKTHFRIWIKRIESYFIKRILALENPRAGADGKILLNFFWFLIFKYKLHHLQLYADIKTFKNCNRTRSNTIVKLSLKRELILIRRFPYFTFANLRLDFYITYYRQRLRFSI